MTISTAGPQLAAASVEFGVQHDVHDYGRTRGQRQR